MKGKKTAVLAIAGALLTVSAVTAQAATPPPTPVRPTATPTASPTTPTATATAAPAAPVAGSPRFTG